MAIKLTKRSGSVRRDLGFSLAILLAPGLTHARREGSLADPCSVLPVSELARVVGQPYAAPQASVAPAAFRNSVRGTECDYTPQQGESGKVTYIVYTDPSVAIAKDTFTKLKAFFGPQAPSAGIGDDSYVDPNHAIHVRKGAVRYFISLEHGAASAKTDAQVRDLALWVAGRV